MLTIRAEQMAALDEAASSRFHNRLMVYLREEIPGATSGINDEALMQHIIDSERRAAKYNIESEAGIAQFVCLTFAAGADFDEIPEIQEYLQQQDLSGEEKLDELVNYLDALENDQGATPSDILLQPED